MSHAKTFGKGFTAASSAICLFLTALWLPRYLNLGVTLAFFAVLAVPFALNCLKTLDNSNQHNPDAHASVKKAKNLLMALQGFGFACWFFDVISTIFLINILGTAEELNILGWPFSALGALVFYVPMVFVAYFLLFGVKSKMSFYVTAVISVLVVFMGALNLNAALYNFGKIDPYSSLGDFVVVGLWLGVLVVLAVVNVAAFRVRRQA